MPRLSACGANPQALVKTLCIQYTAQARTTHPFAVKQR
nr:MAG TPA: hypothetical protein [Bacteriophage sp.]DAW26166.1 MAG TPA: hypothetical protein [Caudoviricetes sp.]DAW70543.1 MAG TPA: hypothetical protein [Caudoviricetes sp.]DAX32310.1 MAG TPA: hypothetical protein [Caudoviricetes sp.]